MTNSTRSFTAPVFLGTAVFVFGMALVEKLLNFIGWSLPLVDAEPRQFLDWAVVLLMFEIALGLRQLIDLRLRDSTDPASVDGVRLPH